MAQLRAILLLTLCAWGLAQEYKEVFRDDFNDGIINTKKWNVITINSTVNDELQYYSWDEVWEEKGMLVLRTQKRLLLDRLYTSGRVDTQNKFQFLYGTVEWQVQCPRGKGIWPALWLLYWECPPATPCTHWPPEIDVLELRGDLPNRINTTLHYGRWPNNSYDGSATDGPEDYTVNFHRFKVIWEVDKIVWFIDGVEVFRVTDEEKIPHEELYLIMNTAVGGNFPGSPDETTRFPQYFLIDYVKVHQVEPTQAK